MNKLRFYWRVVKHDLWRAWRSVVDGGWLALADLLWLSPAYREAYYAYRQQCWQQAKDYLTFPQWVREGGWRGL